ncbi:hypothetical protein AB0K60_03480 [Thermopolyspora sp. NPDC052614]|uniref:hypothetical protein n=1 Tax=Thermopolyspora sp. NPDC052614 TaxID=3155682 RepID=UPI00341280B2
MAGVRAAVPLVAAPMAVTGQITVIGYAEPADAHIRQRDVEAAVKLPNLDLNLLVSLDVLLEERSATRAALAWACPSPPCRARSPGCGGTSTIRCSSVRATPPS